MDKLFLLLSRDKPCGRRKETDVFSVFVKETLECIILKKIVDGLSRSCPLQSPWSAGGTQSTWGHIECDSTYVHLHTRLTCVFFQDYCADKTFPNGKTENLARWGHALSPGPHAVCQGWQLHVEHLRAFFPRTDSEQMRQS